ncbi:hypothetical protein PMIN03_002035 [Paraphaeosphaeria minitans]
MRNVRSSRENWPRKEKKREKEKGPRAGSIQSGSQRLTHIRATWVICSGLGRCASDSRLNASWEHFRRSWKWVPVASTGATCVDVAIHEERSSIKVQLLGYVV